MGHRISLYYPEAPSGTFEVHPHGETATDAEAFSDFDCLTPLTSSQYVLTANGRAAFFVKSLVDVVVRDATGVLVDSFPDGVRAELVELQSPSFTGLLESGSQGVGGVAYEGEVLDRWITSAGAPDWKVRRSQATADETIVEALDAIETAYSPFFDVTRYGAVADGVTDDSPAVERAYAACVAAGGGILYFPARTANYYLVTPLAITSNRVSVLGAGRSASRITCPAAAFEAFSINAPGNAGYIANLGFDSAVAGTGALSILAVADGFQIVNCGFLWTSVPAAGGIVAIFASFVHVVHCHFKTVGSGNPWIQTTAAAFNVLITNCIFEHTDAGSGAWLWVQGAYNWVDSCYFYLANNNNGARNGAIDVTAATAFEFKITNCRMKMPAAPTLVPACLIRYSADIDGFEEGNTIDLTIGATYCIFYDASEGAAVRLAKLERGSRNRANHATNPGAAYTPSADFATHSLYINANVIINLTNANGAPGNMGRLSFIIRNTTAGALNVTWAAGYAISVSPSVIPATGVLPAGVGRFEFMRLGNGAATVVWILISQLLT